MSAVPSAPSIRPGALPHGRNVVVPRVVLLDLLEQEDLGQAICAACPLAAIGRLRRACLTAWRPAGCACTLSSTGRGGTSGNCRCEASATGHGRAHHRPRGPQAAGGPVPGGWPSPSPSRCGGALPFAFSRPGRRARAKFFFNLFS
jgi:hypothetical protein